MNRFTLAVRHACGRVWALVFFAAVAIPSLAWAQIDSSTSSQSQSSTTTTVTETTDFVSDWRFWALLGAVLLVILIIALSRGRDTGERTTVVK